MKRFALRTALAALLAGVASQALAADLVEPVVEPAPVVAAEPVVADDLGGWYIRGDVGYNWSKTGDIDYINYGDPGHYGHLRGDLDGAFSLGGGVGYQATDHFRVDLTADHWFKRDFKGTSAGSWDDDDDVDTADVSYTTTDKSAVSTWLLLANAYVDIGTWNGFTPYVGAGIGGAHVKWDTLRNSNNPGGPPGGPFDHEGHGSWRFAAAAMVGASYSLTCNLKLDAGYRYSHISGGKMFGFNAEGNNGPGFDRGFNTHEVRAGLRYQFGSGGGNDCGATPVAYEPPPVAPVYK